MTTLSQIAAKIEVDAAVAAAHEEAIRIAEQADIENALIRLNDLRKDLSTKLGTQLQLLRTVMAGGNVLSNVLEDIDTLADVDLTIDEIEDLIADAQAAVAEHRIITFTMKNGDYATYGSGCICGRCGDDEGEYAAEDARDAGDESSVDPIDPDALGAALQNALANGSLTPDGGPQEISVGGRKLKVVPLGLTGSVEDAADLVAKILAGATVN